MCSSFENLTRISSQDQSATVKGGGKKSDERVWSLIHFRYKGGEMVQRVNNPSVHATPDSVSIISEEHR